VVPSEDEIILLLPNATNNPSSGLQQTAFNAVAVVCVLVVQVIPSGDVIIALTLVTVATATNRFNSALQHTEVKTLAAILGVLAVQSNPFGDVATYVVFAPSPTATKILNSGLQQMDLQPFAFIAVDVRRAHVFTTLTASLDCEALKKYLGITLRSLYTPTSRETIAPLLIAPVDETAQKIPNSGDQHILLHALSTGFVLSVQLIPSTLVASLVPVPVIADAQKTPNSGLQVTHAH
jgi:hypothetical protein